MKANASNIYIAAARRVGYFADEPADKTDLAVVEHILRAILEVLTPEQQAEILAKVK